VRVHAYIHTYVHTYTHSTKHVFEFSMFVYACTIYTHVARGALERLDPFVTQGAGRRVEEIRILRIAFFGLMYLRQKDFRVFNRLDCSGYAELNVGGNLTKVTEEKTTRRLRIPQTWSCPCR